MILFPNPSPNYKKDRRWFKRTDEEPITKTDPETGATMLSGNFQFKFFEKKHGIDEGPGI